MPWTSRVRRGRRRLRRKGLGHRRAEFFLETCGRCHAAVVPDARKLLSSHTVDVEAHTDLIAQGLEVLLHVHRCQGVKRLGSDARRNEAGLGLLGGAVQALLDLGGGCCLVAFYFSGVVLLRPFLGGKHTEAVVVANTPGEASKR